MAAVERKSEMTAMDIDVFVMNFVVALVTAVLTSMHCKFLYFL